ncbi:MAG: cysteine desulfurase [Gemmatimonadales bacterium]|nr:MAG: cysteine desulfurase [Gemmatimonadales bacterium]
MNRIYLDHAATTPLRPSVARVMAQVALETPGNPSSPHHEGRMARGALEAARRRLADVLGVPPGWVHFTHGGTESDNLAVEGRARAEPRGAIVISAVEHSAVRETAAHLAGTGHRVIVLPVLPSGEIDPGALSEALAAPVPPALVSVQAVNSETGLVLELGPVLERATARGVPVHVDAVQALGRIPLPEGVALLSLSAHKVGGPRGMGVLVRDPSVALHPLHHGGSQESGLRPGTENVAGAVGSAEAIEAAEEERPHEAARLGALRQRLETALLGSVPGLRIHGSEGARAPHILGVGLPGIPGDLLPGALDLEGVAASAGSACRSGTTEPSPTLLALYGEGAAAVAPVRLSLGRGTTAEGIEEAIPRILGVFERVRAGFAGAG